MSKHSQTLRLRDGRELGFAEYGSPDGYVVIYCHGLPGSRFEASLWHASAVDHKVRLIALDRPGMGLSTPKSGRAIVDFPSDVAELSEHLDLHEYAVMSVSGGSMYALACGAQKEKLPGLQAISIVAGLGPRSISQAGMSWFQRFAFVAMDWVPGKLVGWLWDVMIGKAARDPDRSMLEKRFKKSIQAVSGPDKEVLKDEGVVLASIESLRGAFVQGSDGYVQEATLVAQAWGFDLTSIQDLPIKLWYGEKDDLAPPAVGMALAERIVGASCTIFDHDGHTGTVLKHQPEILKTLIKSLITD